MPSSACKKCARSEEHTSELQSHDNLVCRLLLEKKITRPLLPGRTSPDTQAAAGHHPRHGRPHVLRVPPAPSDRTPAQDVVPPFFFFFIPAPDGNPPLPTTSPLFGA